MRYYRTVTDYFVSCDIREEGTQQYLTHYVDGLLDMAQPFGKEFQLKLTDAYACGIERREGITITLSASEAAELLPTLCVALNAAKARPRVRLSRNATYHGTRLECYHKRGKDAVPVEAVSVSPQLSLTEYVERINEAIKERRGEL